MKYSCLHTHTIFCDGKDDIETFCRCAWEKGLVSIGFSAHAPIGRKTGFKTDWHLADDRLDEYVEAVHAARCRWEGKLRVFLGLEVDFIPGLMGPVDADYSRLGLDYIIGSVHYLIPPNGAEPFTVDGSAEELEKGLCSGFGGDGEALAAAYWDAEEAMIRAGGLDILGHADLIRKNNGARHFFNPAGEADLRRTKDIAGAAAAAGIIVEVNTGGLNRKKIDDTYPSIPFLRLFQENNVPVIITADAHRAKDLDGHYGDALSACRAAGYTETVLFEGRENSKALWKKEFLTTNDTNSTNIGFSPDSCCS